MTSRTCEEHIGVLFRRFRWHDSVYCRRLLFSTNAESWSFTLIGVAMAEMALSLRKLKAAKTIATYGKNRSRAH